MLLAGFMPAVGGCPTVEPVLLPDGVPEPPQLARSRPTTQPITPVMAAVDLLCVRAIAPPHLPSPRARYRRADCAASLLAELPC
jgi:hypothetical protein